METQTAETGTQAAELSDVLSVFIAEVMRYSTGDILRLLQRDDLSMPRLGALMYLDLRGASSISDIREYLNLSLGTTSHLVDQLVCGGYVSRAEDPNDRRLKLVALTERGAAFVAEVKHIRVKELARRLQEAPAPLLEAAVGTMRDLVAYLRDEAAPVSDSRSATDIA